MKTKLILVSPSDSVRAAWRLLREHKIRHLPVVQEGRLVGIVTDRDIRLIFPSTVVGQPEPDPHDALEQVSVREIMAEQVITVSPEATIADATRLLLKHRIGGLPVLQGERLVGIITKSDILAASLEIMEGKGSGQGA